MPGLIVTQHSGEGKANQYFLRGFNLDHGTDLAIKVDGMPVNMPTHGHGQGYADINFLIPELVGSVNVRKGPYFADQGDFASAGAVARTIGVHLARTPYVAFSDDDSWWEPGALARAAELFDAHPRLGLIAARVLVGADRVPDPINAAMAGSPLPSEPGLPGPSVLGFLACAAILIIGGSSFIGLHLTASALAAGHKVTTFNRGLTNTDADPECQRIALRGRFANANPRHDPDGLTDPNAHAVRI